MAVDHWEGEDVIITIETEGEDTVQNYEGKITSYRRSGGASSTDERYAFGGKTYNFQKPREKFTIEFDYVTTDPRFTNLVFSTQTGLPGSDEVKSDSVTKRQRIILWFTPKDNQVKSGDIVIPGNAGEVFRIIHVDCKGVTNDVDFAADDMMTGTISFECSATDSDGYPNIIEEYDGTSAGGLTVLVATTHRGTLTWQTTTTKAWTGSYRT